jgi:hypothetical protein
MITAAVVEAGTAALFVMTAFGAPMTAQALLLLEGSAGGLAAILAGVWRKHRDGMDHLEKWAQSLNKLSLSLDKQAEYLNKREKSITWWEKTLS